MNKKVLVEKAIKKAFTGINQKYVKMEIIKENENSIRDQYTIDIYTDCNMPHYLVGQSVDRVTVYAWNTREGYIVEVNDDFVMQRYFFQTEKSSAKLIA
jgi:hypothetical protein